MLALLGDSKTKREAFSAVVEQYGEKLYWQVRRMVLSHDDANDVLQNVFLKAWTNIDTFRRDSKLSTWLYRIAVNECLDFIKKKKSGGGQSVDAANRSVASTLLADPFFDGDETQAMLQDAIAKLPDVQRSVFNMRYYGQMKYSEMSRILGTSEGALKASYHIAVRKISDYFKKND